MVVSGTVRFLQSLGLISLGCTAALIAIKPALAQTEPSTRPQQTKQVQPVAPNSEIPRSLELNSSLLSLQGGQRLMQEAGDAVNGQNYTLALKKLQEARQVFNQLSNFYQELAASFSGIDNRVADSQRQQAIETAQMRDEATYQLALVHRAQNQPELAVPLLIQIVRSQNPTRELGKKAYQQLFELGFVDAPYPRPRGGEPTSSNQ